MHLGLKAHSKDGLGLPKQRGKLERCACGAKNRDATRMPILGVNSHVWAPQSRWFEIGGLEGHCLLVLAGRNVSMINALSAVVCIPRFTSPISRFQRVVFVINLGVRHSWCKWFSRRNPVEMTCKRWVHEDRLCFQAFPYRVSVWHRERVLGDMY